MSQYKKNLAEKLIVNHSFSNRGVHFYDVFDEFGKKIHEVTISVNCICDFQSIQGTPNSNACAGIIAVCKKIAETGDIKIDPFATKIDRRNIAKNLVKQSNRRINEIRYSGNEGELHRKKKDEICENLQLQKKKYITEAIFEKSLLKADIFVLDDFKIIEIADSESQESLDRKESEYKKLGLKFEVIKIE